MRGQETEMTVSGRGERRGLEDSRGDSLSDSLPLSVETGNRDPGRR